MASGMRNTCMALTYKININLVAEKRPDGAEETGSSSFFASHCPPFAEIK